MGGRVASDRRLGRSGPGGLRRGAAALGTAIWCLAYGWPIVAVLRRSVRGVAGRDGLDVGTLAVLGESRTLHLAAVTVGQTLASVLVVVVVGVPIGWVLARLDFPGRRLLEAVVMVPFVLPTLAVASAVVALVGRVPASDAGRFALIVAAHCCLNLGLMVRWVATAVSRVPASMEESARSLGRGPVAAVVDTTLRLVRPQLRQAVLVVATFCLTSFGVIVAIGGTSLATLEVEVWYLSTRALDLGRAAVLVIAQLLVVAALIGAQRTRRPLPAAVEVRRRRPRGRAERVAVVGTFIAVGAVSVAPLVVLATRSLRTGSGWGIDHWRRLLTEAPQGGPVGARPLVDRSDVLAALGQSLLGAVVAAALALLLAAPLAIAASDESRTGRMIERLLVVPLSISAATLGLGYLLAFGTGRIDLRGSWIAVPLIQALTAAPVAARVLIGAVRSLDRSPWQAAAVLGAGPWRRFRTVTVPLLARPVVVAGGFAFAMAVGEFGATVFLARTDRPTIPILISRLLGRAGPNNLGQAMALSCLLALIVALSVLVVDRRGRSRPF